MDERDLKTILEKHKLWLEGAEGGERADFQYVDLRGADLRYANLKNAKISNCIGDGRRIKNIIGLEWNISFTKDQLAIGYEQHSIEEWESFSDKRIAEMHSEALEFWGNYKNFILSTVAYVNEGVI
jgi:hypothetical protein